MRFEEEPKPEPNTICPWSLKKCKDWVCIATGCNR